MRSIRVLSVWALAVAGGIAAGNLAVPATGAATREATPKPEDDPSRARDCLVILQTVPIPSQEAGQIKAFNVREGQEVSEKALLALIDDSQAKMAKQVAYYKLKAAEEEADDDVSVRYAEMAQVLAQNEYDQGEDTFKRNQYAISLFERRRLKHEVEKQKLGVEEAKHKLTVAKVTADERRAEVDATELEIRRREIRSPCFGRIEKRSKQPGEWVKPGDTVLEILQTDLAYVRGYINAKLLAPEDVEGRPVRVTVSVKGSDETFEGTIIFVGYTIDDRGLSPVKAKVENRRKNDHWILRDGMPAEMIMVLKR